jgi:hypothetical protein
LIVIEQECILVNMSAGGKNMKKGREVKEKGRQREMDRESVHL